MIPKCAMVVCLLIATATVPSCIAVGGNQNEQKPTAGQELVDLKLALDKGAITQAEFDAKKAQILAKK